MPAHPILVTGIHRSGSTWVGHMLALAPGVAYVHEPFNMDYAHPGKCTARFPYRFTYVTGDNEAPYLRPLWRTLTLRYNLWPEIRATRALRRPVRDALGFARLRLAGTRTLMKDPMAVFSTEWLAAQFAMAVVVCVRHPAAFAGSVKRFGWSTPFAELLAQPLLRRDWLQPHVEEIRAAGDWPIVDQAALLWRVIYDRARLWRARHPDWLFVRHEDLSRRPRAEFEALYRALGLAFSADIAAEILAHSSADNPSSAPPDESAPGLRLNSLANIWNWQERLTAAEVARVRAIAGEAADAWYDDADWGRA